MFPRSLINQVYAALACEGMKPSPVGEGLRVQIAVSLTNRDRGRRPEASPDEQPHKRRFGERSQKRPSTQCAVRKDRAAVLADQVKAGSTGQGQLRREGRQEAHYPNRGRSRAPPRFP